MQTAQSTHSTNILSPIRSRQNYPAAGRNLYVLKTPPANTTFLKEFKQALCELRLVEQGMLKARPAAALLDEL